MGYIYNWIHVSPLPLGHLLAFCNHRGILIDWLWQHKELTRNSHSGPGCLQSLRILTVPMPGPWNTLWRHLLRFLLLQERQILPQRDRAYRWLKGLLTAKRNLQWKSLWFNTVQQIFTVYLLHTKHRFIAWDTVLFSKIIEHNCPELEEILEIVWSDPLTLEMRNSLCSQGKWLAQGQTVGSWQAED